MDRNLEPYIKVSEEAAQPDLPHLILELSASKALSLTLPYTIRFTIKHQDAQVAKPLILEWSAHIHGFSKEGFLLFRHAEKTLETIPIDHSNLVDISRHGPLSVNGWNQDLWELSADGLVSFQTSLPGRYQSLLEPNETYTLLWPGGHIELWEYGTIRNRLNQDLNDNSQPLTLPGSPHITFTTHITSPPWPIREERVARLGYDRANRAEQQWRYAQQRAKEAFPRTQHIKHDDNAPNLSVFLSCPPEYHEGEPFQVTVTVTVTCLAHPTAQTITFHTQIFDDDTNFQLGRFQNGKWINYDDESANPGFMIVDDPDVSVNVGQDERFTSLMPGETWCTSQQLEGASWSVLPSDAEDGEGFRYAFLGEGMDWWDWGAKKDHEGTVVKVSCWGGPVVEPGNNDGRPKVGVQGSNVVEFRYVKKG